MMIFTNQERTIGYIESVGFCAIDSMLRYTPLITEVHCGSIHYRVPKTSKRYSRRRLGKILRPCKIEMPNFELPF